MGTASAELAVQAGKMVAKDVAAIDVNSGCPKHFSMHAGMGAALLQKPDTLVDILSSLVTQVGQPNNISISVKIRILDDPEKTYALVRRLVKTGISCLTLHCRTTPMRPREPVIRDALSTVVDICHEAGVACYVNGDVAGRWQLPELMEKYKVDGAMVARAAESNPSCFGAENEQDLKPFETVVKQYVGICRQYDNHHSNTKFCLARLVPGKHPVFQKLNQSKAMETTEEIISGLEVGSSTHKHKHQKQRSHQPHQVEEQSNATPEPASRDIKTSKRPAEECIENGSGKKIATETNPQSVTA